MAEPTSTASRYQSAAEALGAAVQHLDACTTGAELLAMGLNAREKLTTQAPRVAQGLDSLRASLGAAAAALFAVLVRVPDAPVPAGWLVTLRGLHGDTEAMLRTLLGLSVLLKSELVLSLSGKLESDLRQVEHAGRTMLHTARGLLVELEGDALVRPTVTAPSSSAEYLFSQLEQDLEAVLTGLPSRPPTDAELAEEPAALFTALNQARESLQAARVNLAKLGEVLHVR